MDYKYRVTVIVPIYNQESYLEKSVPSLLAQTMPKDDLEILLIDDGSTDCSPQMCDEYAALHENVFVIHKENGGLSDARNCGIDHARGKYLMYLDGDDWLKEDTCQAVADFFDKHYNEIDLVTYPSVTIKQGEVSKPHYRYTVFRWSGIYDLTDDQNIFAAVTRIEVCVKNLGKNNVRFSDNRDFRQEDQKYCTDVLLDKLRVGFCNEGAYYYEQQADGLQNTTFYAYYLFENTMEFWEEEFAKFEDEVPRYLQALYVSDVNWKYRMNVLIPYHYDESELKRAIHRVEALLERVDVTVIIGHPALDSFSRAFLLQRKRNCDVQLLNGYDSLAIVADGEFVYSRGRIEIIFLRGFPKGNCFEITAFLKSPCFQFGGKPRLYANTVIDGEHALSEVPLRKSSWSYNGSKIETNEFWLFVYKLEVGESGSVDFLVDFNGQRFKTNYYFMPTSVFIARSPKRFEFKRQGWSYKFQPNEFRISKCDSSPAPKAAPVKKRRRLKDIFRKHKQEERAETPRELAEALKAVGRRIWLYHDCHGVEKNNAYYQYMYDIEMDDGIERYYVVNDPIPSKSHLFTPEQMENVIEFRTKKHQELFLAAEKVITAYVERVNWMPFTNQEMRSHLDIFDAEVVYLQHGVLHAHQPWKYSLDRLLIDREVISTGFERQNLLENYCFEERNLIDAGMPRYDFIDSDAKPKRKILLAPSWRKYLVRQKRDGQWYGVPNVFENSKYYRETKALLENAQLHEALEKYDFTLDFKLHPILEELYRPLFDLNSPRVSLAPSSVEEVDYAIFITDFSSYRFDFVYLKRAIMYFFPDEDEFKSGMCDYRETDLPLEGMFGDMARTADEAVKLLVSLMESGGEPRPEYKQQMDGFFLHYDNGQRERIYRALTE